MRITYKMMTTKYTTNLNNMSTELDRLNTQVASGRKFAKTSEDTSSAIKAYQIRRDLAKLEGYQNNINHAADYLTNSETNLGDINETLADATDKILQGKNDTQNPETRKIIANELRMMQKQMLDTLNSKVGDTYIFGGSNTVEKPFTVGAEGQLLYNKTDVDSLDDSTQALKDTLNNLKADSLYVDVGLGVSIDGVTKEVNPNTVFNYSTPGINIVGNGTSEITVDGIKEKVSNNAYNLLGKIAEQFESENYSGDITDQLYGKFQSATSQASKSTTEIGARANYLEFMKERYDTQELNLQTRQTEVEGIDAAYTYISFQTQKVAYQAALQMGNSIIQSSVFDYMS